jgi:hypothetical protein
LIKREKLAFAAIANFFGSVLCRRGLRRALAGNASGVAMQFSISEKVSPAGVFQPDILTVDQAADQRRPDESASPELRLMLAVIDEALLTYRRYAQGTGRVARRRFAEVERWIASSDGAWLYSFESICEALGLQASAVRRSLWDWKGQQPLGGGGKLRKWRRVAGGRRHVISPRGWDLGRSS